MTSEILAGHRLGRQCFEAMSMLRPITSNCSGQGWVTDFVKVNQAYTATVIDLTTLA